ncbi:MAG: hypothetical protein U0X20_20375 [Caldilineaceae bacterium]
MASQSGGEPPILQKGKVFHHNIQVDWHQRADGLVLTEVEITKPNGRKGRIDVLVDTEDNLVAVVEIKNTNWDPPMKDHRLEPNVRRHIRQVWDYMEAVMGPDNEGTPVSPALLYRHKPSDPARVQLIEELCDYFSVQVVWEEDAQE